MDISTLKGDLNFVFMKYDIENSECDLQVVGWCDVCWKVLRQHLSIGGVANFFGDLSGGIVAWQQRQHRNLSFMKTKKNVTTLL